MQNETIGSFLNKLAARTPEVTGGATAALHAAEGAALLAMTARYSATQATAAQTATVAAIARQAGQLQAESVALIAADGEAFAAVATAYQLPRNAAAERTARSEAIAAALVTAAGPPAAVIEVGGRLLALAEELQPIVNRTVAADLAAAVWAIRAAIAVSRTNVAANLSGSTQASAAARLGSVLARADGLEQRILQLLAAGPERS